MSLSHWKSLAVVPLLLCFACSPEIAPTEEEEVADVGASQSSALVAPAGSLLLPRYQHTATLLANGKVLVVGGGTPSETATTELYDPATATSTSGPAMAAARRAHTATQLQDGSVLVVGGVGPGGLLSSVERYQPSTNTWTAAASLPRTSYGHSATLLSDGRVLVVGGVGIVTNADVYNPATNTWTATGALNAGMMGQAAVRLADGRVLVAGGYNGVTSSSTHAEIWSPSTGAWTTVASMNAGRNGHTLLLLSSGKVLVSGYVPAAELYDPAVNTWTNTGATAVTHFSAPSVTRPDGSILMAGGSYNTLGVELYAPATGTWSTVGTLTASRTDHPTVALADGRVLFLGGTTFNTQGNMQPLASVEVFDPAITCVPTTCQAQGKSCGTISNGCGGTLSCGTCGTGLTCTNNVCSCIPTTCQAQGKNCGTISNGCGGTLSCGSCGTGLTCTNNVCAAAPACGHDVCSYGTALSKSCSMCANTVCNRDPYCCTNSWDSICVNEANTYCAIAQPGCVAP